MEGTYMDSDSRYNDVQRWFTYLRRHNATIFDVFFKDKEDIADEDIVATVKDVAKFFGLPVPVLHDKCESIAKVMTNINATECELHFNWLLMEKAGINNTDTLCLSFVHELSHQLLYQTRFLLFENELWIQELAADMVVGAFSTIDRDVATGKYKYVLRQLSASMTHPAGDLRASIVEFGRDHVSRLREEGNFNDIKDVLTGLPAFVYSHYCELQDSWDAVKLNEMEEEGTMECKHMDYESLPDTNLLKQYYLKHVKNNKGDEI